VLSRLLLSSIISVIVSTSMIPTVRAQLVQQGPKLVGTGAVGNATEGTSVAVSRDGNTAVVGGPSDNGNTGAAWVFTRSGGVGTPPGGKPVRRGAPGVG